MRTPASLLTRSFDMLRPPGRVVEYAKGDVLFVEGDTNLDLYGWFGVVGVDPVEVQVF
ncbi:hypothetical protein [Candidatus Spongiisocius sp.]|uniref:hypothetical protein n=1 Tax=Candidatus Spongiisocius sp. TaxID=3101273 RepID=UPI003B5C7399